MKFTSIHPWMLKPLLPNMKNLLLHSLALLTRHPRYRPKIEWSDSSFFFNLFRIYEQIFGKRWGAALSAITSGTKDEEGNTEIWHAFYTWEAALVHYEAQLRARIKEWNFEFVPVRIMIPAFNGYAPGPLPQGYLFAVGFNTYTTATTTSTSVSSLTSSHTAAGSDRFGLALSTLGRSGSDIGISYTGATWGGNAMTDKNYNYTGTLNGGYRTSMKVYVYIAPAASAENVVVSFSGNLESSSRLGWFVTSWTGVDQSTPIPDGNVINDTGNPKSNTATASRADSAVLGMAIWNSFSLSYSGSGTLISGDIISYSSHQLSAAYNLNVSGALAQTWNDSFGGGLNTAVYAIAIQPPISGPANLKTYNTNAKANIKTMNTNPIANVKTFDTNA